MSVFGVILVRIFPHSEWIRRNTPRLSVFSPMPENAGKMGTIITPNTDTFYVVFIKNFCYSLILWDYFFWNYFLLIFLEQNFCLVTSETWTRTLDPDSEKHGPWKTWNKYGIKKYVWIWRVTFYKDHTQCDLLLKSPFTNKDLHCSDLLIITQL